MTRTPLSRSQVKVTRPLCSPPCWRVRRLQRWTWEHVGRGKLLLRCRLLGGARRFGAHGGRRGAGAYRGGRPPTACYILQFLQCINYYASVRCSTSRIGFKQKLASHLDPAPKGACARVIYSSIVKHPPVHSSAHSNINNKL